MTVMRAILCGLDELCNIMTFADDKAEFFKEEFGIEKIAGTTGEVIAVDGEAICSISKTKQRHSALQTAIAYLMKLLEGRKRHRKRPMEYRYLKKC